MKRDEIAYAVLQPHFDAVRDLFASFSPAPGVKLAKLIQTKFLIDAKVGRGGTRLPHCEGRHYAATRDDGLRMYFAPDFVTLPFETMVAILAHEFGHAADHTYPASWLMPPGGPGKATWIGQEDTRRHREWQRLWRDRSIDQIEWAADGIAEAVTGRRIGYSGACMLQRFDAGIERPVGLR